MKKIFFHLAILLCCNQITAQLAVSNFGNMQLHAGASFTSVGSFTNNSSSALVNGGSLYVGGDFTNNQSGMATGTGTLYLNGTANQNISGTQPININNLNTNNSAGITLNNTVMIFGTHTFSAGIITTSASSPWLMYQSSASFTGASDAAHIKGWVRKIGDTDFIFPVGNDTYLREIALTNISAFGSFDVTYNGATTNTNVLVDPLKQINPYEYWTINQAAGFAQAKVTLNWNRSKVNFPGYILSDIRAAQYNSGWTNAGGSYTGALASGSITSNPLTSFGAFGVGSVSLSVVPLLFIQVAANRHEGANWIEWSTANEQNVAFLEVQRSTDGQSFSHLATVAPHNQAQTQNYSHTDPFPFNGIVYYRIKSVDRDGGIKYSKIVSVKNNSPEELRLLQNPVQKIAVFIAGTTPALYLYRFLSLDGKQLATGSIDYNGSGSFSINLPAYINTGTYLLQLKTGNSSTTFKILKQ